VVKLILPWTISVRQKELEKEGAAFMDSKLLLTTVFKPFAIDDLFSRRENIPELMMSQITRVQGIFSYRAWHANSGLHMIAANCGIPTTVMEWPSLEEFEKEIAISDYDYVGISFIPSTLLKMREMITVIRRVSPKSKIVIGGHGTMVPDIEHFVDVDYICKGDGIRFFRNLLGLQPRFEFSHPVVKSRIVEFLGIPISSFQVGQIVTGLGCQYGCEFCVTSAFFDCEYQPFLTTGTELFELIRKQYSEEKLKSFWIIDENFLLNKQRAMEFRDMLANNYEQLSDCTIDMIWSSSDNVIQFEPEQLAEMGITRLWIGYESTRSGYSKNNGINIKELVNRLKKYGISTLLSCTMLCDFHDDRSWREELEDFITYGQAFSQFLPLTALPGTPLFSRLSKEDRLLNTIPWEERHGLATLTHKHPYVPLWKQEELVLSAYQKEYVQNGPSQIRDLQVRIQGYNTFANSSNRILLKRATYLKEHLKNQMPWLIATKEFVLEGHKTLVGETIQQLKMAIGDDSYLQACETSKYLIRVIKKSLALKNSKEVVDREPGLRTTRYDGINSTPIETISPSVW
jgi:radical SAM superfamily enzyme YgiQ (UPF0313 family)